MKLICKYRQLFSSVDALMCLQGRFDRKALYQMTRTEENDGHEYMIRLRALVCFSFQILFHMWCTGKAFLRCDFSYEQQDLISGDNSKVVQY